MKVYLVTTSRKSSHEHNNGAWCIRSEKDKRLDHINITSVCNILAEVISFVVTSSTSTSEIRKKALVLRLRFIPKGFWCSSIPVYDDQKRHWPTGLSFLMCNTRERRGSTRYLEWIFWKDHREQCQDCLNRLELQKTFHEYWIADQDVSSIISNPRSIAREVINVKCHSKIIDLLSHAYDTWVWRQLQKPRPWNQQTLLPYQSCASSELRNQNMQCFRHYEIR